MMNFIKAKAVGDTSPKPHILFNAAPRTGITTQETEIRANTDYAPSCMTNTMKKYKVFSEPEGGIGFAWASGKAYSREAVVNLIQVASELFTRAGE